MIKFKKADLSDVELIRTLAKKSWTAAYRDILSQDQIEYMLKEMYSTLAISNQLQNPNYCYYLILNENIPAGFIGFEFNFEENTTKLHRIYLLAEFKGKGLGKKALIFLKQQVKESSNTRIILNVNIQNPAIEMYQSQGFEIYHKEAFDIGNGFLMDDFLLEYFVNT